MAVQQFASWSEAFDFCRDANHPVLVRVTNADDDETAKIYPSGACKTITVHRSIVSLSRDYPAED